MQSTEWLRRGRAMVEWINGWCSGLLDIPRDNVKKVPSPPQPETNDSVYSVFDTLTPKGRLPTE